MYILLLLILSNSLHTKVTPIDALSFSFQREMTMCTKGQSIVSFFPKIMINNSSVLIPFS